MKRSEFLALMAAPFLAPFVKKERSIDKYIYGHKHVYPQPQDWGHAYDAQRKFMSEDLANRPTPYGYRPGVKTDHMYDSYRYMWAYYDKQSVSPWRKK